MRQNYQEYGSDGKLVREWSEEVPDPPTEPTTLAQVDTAALDAALTAASKATTVTTLRAAVLAIGSAITPVEQ